MLRYSVSQAALERTSLDADIALLAELGEPAMGLLLPTLRAFGVDEGARCFADRGVAVASVASAALPPLTDRAAWPAALDQLRRDLDDIVTVGSSCLQFMSGGPGALSYEEADVLFGDLLAEMLVQAEARLVVLALEHNHTCGWTSATSTRCTTRWSWPTTSTRRGSPSAPTSTTPGSSAR